MDPIISLSPLSIAETNIIINALIQRPYGEVKDLADKIIAEAKSQVEIQEELAKSAIEPAVPK